MQVFHVCFSQLHLSVIANDRTVNIFRSFFRRMINLSHDDDFDLSDSGSSAIYVSDDDDKNLVKEVSEICLTSEALSTTCEYWRKGPRKSWFFLFKPTPMNNRRKQWDM